MKKFVFGLAGGVCLVVGMIVLRHYTHGGWFWHPLAEGNNSTCSKTDHSGCGYGFWSGSGSDIAEITIFFSAGAFLGMWWRKHNCHVNGCPRLEWQPHPVHAHPVCRKHHPSGQGRGKHLDAAEHSIERHLEILEKRHPTKVTSIRKN